MEKEGRRARGKLIALKNGQKYEIECLQLKNP
jgi:hypothetical protein